MNPEAVARSTENPAHAAIAFLHDELARRPSESPPATSVVPGWFRAARFTAPPDRHNMVPMPAGDKQVARVEIARRKPRTSSGPTWPGTTTELPPDVINRSAKRVGFLGLVCAVTAPAAYLAELYLQPVRVLAPDVPFRQITAIGVFVLGLALFVASWSGKLQSSLVVDLGLIFEVLVGLAISLSEYADGWPEDPVRSVSWICRWLPFCVMAVPPTFGNMALASIATALMAPLGLLVAAQIKQNELPSQN